MVNASSAYWIALLPLLAALIIFFFGRWLPWRGALLGIAAVAVSLCMSIDLYWQLLDGTLKAGFELSWSWFSAGIYPFEWGLLLDGPSIVMLLVVSAVSLLVQVYSLGYMRDSPRFKRFFAYLSLFTFSMLALVLSNNYIQFFMCWELVGACSYFLISFEFEREAAGRAGNKAFIMTRLGDLGFYAGLLVLFFGASGSGVGTFNFVQIHQHFLEGSIHPTIAPLIALLIFCGAVGKSAQLPLHTWLPDAMEGPTPVSALIHSATMVAAGVFLVARSYSFFLSAPSALEAVAWVGGLTALMAALMALAADDVKRVLAFSTMSQLGYMMLAMGVVGYGAGLFHLTTHAAFKALLFLAAGSVIHAVHTNDMRKMGSLSKQMLTTTLTFFCGYLALIGFPLTSGYFSKEMILASAYLAGKPWLYGIACVTVFLTALYMTRAFSLIFLGAPRERDRFAHAHEAPWSMTIPMIVLAVAALFLGGFMHLNGLVERLFPQTLVPSGVQPPLAAYLPLGCVFLGLGVGFSLYGGELDRAAWLARVFHPVYQLLSRKFYIDELYEAVVARPTLLLGRGVAWFDSRVVDDVLVNTVGRAALWLSLVKRWFEETPEAPSEKDRLTAAQEVDTRFVQGYLLIIALGFMFLVVWKIG